MIVYHGNCGHFDNSLIYEHAHPGIWEYHPTKVTSHCDFWSLSYIQQKQKCRPINVTPWAATPEATLLLLLYLPNKNNKSPTLVMTVSVSVLIYLPNKMFSMSSLLKSYRKLVQWRENLDVCWESDWKNSCLNLVWNEHSIILCIFYRL